VSQTDDHRGVIEKLLARIGNPLTWSIADRCLLIAGAVLPFAAWHTLIFYDALWRPEASAYYDQAILSQVAPMLAILWLGGWFLIAVAALVVRRRWPEAWGLTPATVYLFCIGGAGLSYAIGPYTSNYMGAVGLSGWIVGLILLDRRVVLRGALLFVLIAYATIFAERWNLVPYAPLLRETPFRDGHLDRTWFLGIGQLTAIAELAGIAVVYFIVSKWREQEEAILATSDQLVRANEFISRFVAAQVAEQIRVGNFRAVDRADRRRLTIFFSDIKEFSHMADRIEPEELSEILHEYFNDMVSIAERYGGTVDKFMGDAIMIFFGAPVGPHEPDHAVRAVRMAMEMQHRMTILRERWRARGVEQPFEVRIGINTGIANVGAFGARGRMDYTAIGRQVNLAARLQVNADPGGILISHATWAFVKDQLQCEEQKEIEVKGFHHPVRVYRVTEVFEPAVAPEIRERERA
jgi:class 3 adenylate cyclase